MRRIDTRGATLAVHDTGTGPPVVLLHGLGLDHSIFDALCAHLPHHRIIRPDLRGHGASSVPPAPYAMGAMTGDVEQVLDALEVRDAVVLGLSLGGMIAQALAIKRLDLVRGLCLVSTAAKIGQPGQWHDRAALALSGGMTAVLDASLKRWGGPDAPAARTAFTTTDPQGYAGGCAAIAGTDLYTPTSGLRLPTLGIAGDRDGSTPPDLVRETTGLIPGSDFALIRGAGHLCPATHPADVARHLSAFLSRIGHV
ncbi:alpha/beta fold hydrolase [Pseudooctadecabacter sp.]|uniref:alpha/beta fold hydrolase n=1 Tax=Pseudooctadecabacter sp. TaxID=1966338 RepID=UPI0025DA9352|nr:alpha/beta fold hydrolase [Pseudooctadecabacter sp.]